MTERGVAPTAAEIRARAPSRPERAQEMKRAVMGCALTVLAVVVGWPAEAQDLQQKVAAAKESAAQNQQALRSYSWLSKTEISLRGEVKNTKIESCRYGPDGQVQKTPVQEPPPAQKKRGVRGRQSLPDGTSYPGTVVLAIPSSKVQVRITNSNYQKLAQ
jgi:hypothetical protein